ncbi:MAG: hypothetical protein KY467_14645 [Gemmatimonadetes bacterium]|nr:hypothetical protein [Gemmatimonadota bacterium]
MRTVRRFATPALAALVALGASGCAGLSFSPGCGFAAADLMTDGASRMNRGFQLHQARAQQQAFQHKAMMGGAEFNRGAIRKPGSLPVAQSTPASPLCFR